MLGVRLDHATLNTNRLGETIAFYKHFLDLKPGWRPDLGIGGAWLYAEDGDYPILHLIEAAQAPSGGMVDHIAFRGVGLDQYLEKVKASGDWFLAVPVPETPLTQVHHLDPNGVKIEVTFEEPLGAESVSSADKS